MMMIMIKIITKMMMMMVITGDAAPGWRGQGVAESWSRPHSDRAPVAGPVRGRGHGLGPRGEAGRGQAARGRRHHPLQVRDLISISRLRGNKENVNNKVKLEAEL